MSNFRMSECNRSIPVVSAWAFQVTPLELIRFTQPFDVHLEDLIQWFLVVVGSGSRYTKAHSHWPPRNLQ